MSVFAELSPPYSHDCEVCGYHGAAAMNEHNVICCTDDWACYERFLQLDKRTKRVLRKRARRAQALRENGGQE